MDNELRTCLYIFWTPSERWQKISWKHTCLYLTSLLSPLLLRMIKRGKCQNYLACTNWFKPHFIFWRILVKLTYFFWYIKHDKTESYTHSLYLQSCLRVDFLKWVIFWKWNVVICFRITGCARVWPVSGNIASWPTTHGSWWRVSTSTTSSS